MDTVLGAAPDAMDALERTATLRLQGEGRRDEQDFRRRLDAEGRRCRAGERGRVRAS